MAKEEHEHKKEEKEEGKEFRSHAYAGSYSTTTMNTSWQGWANGILGLWVIAIPFLAITGAALGWTVAVTGIIVAILGFWATMQKA